MSETDVNPASVFVNNEDGKPGKVPVASYDPNTHRLTRACKTVEVRDKNAKKDAESYVINATDFDAKLHVKVVDVSEQKTVSGSNTNQ